MISSKVVCCAVGLTCFDENEMTFFGNTCGKCWLLYDDDDDDEGGGNEDP